MLDYENAPGETGTPPQHWPLGATLQLQEAQATLVMVAHPHCPCTRATIRELALLMARCEGLVKAYVLFYRPQGFGENWEKSDLWYSAAAIPGVTVIEDEVGAEAQRFHATVSGQTMLYDVQGRLRFNGGITASRGHNGDNAGRSAIVSFLTQGAITRPEVFVFGCRLLGENHENGSVE